jgi:hypothetical protein
MCITTNYSLHKAKGQGGLRIPRHGGLHSTLMADSGTACLSMAAQEAAVQIITRKNPQHIVPIHFYASQVSSLEES